MLNEEVKSRLDGVGRGPLHFMAVGYLAIWNDYIFIPDLFYLKDVLYLENGAANVWGLVRRCPKYFVVRAISHTNDNKANLLWDAILRVSIPLIKSSINVSKHCSKTLLRLDPLLLRICKTELADFGSETFNNTLVQVLHFCFVQITSDIYDDDYDFNFNLLEVIESGVHLDRETFIKCLKGIGLEKNFPLLWKNLNRI
jgi:hypothetical protein